MAGTLRNPARAAARCFGLPNLMEVNAPLEARISARATSHAIVDQAGMRTLSRFFPSARLDVAACNVSKEHIRSQRHKSLDV